MKRYSAKLLYQFRIDSPTPRKKKDEIRLCEESTIMLNARNIDSAIKKFKRIGAARKFDYLNTDQERVYFDFVGIVDIIDLGAEAANEVWYDIYDKKNPMERRDELTLSDEKMRMRARGDNSLKRYSAKLLYQYRADSPLPRKKKDEIRLCEESTIMVNARGVDSAIRKFKRIGAARKFDYLTKDRERVYFEFVGIVKLIDLGFEAAANEVWYDTYRKKNPMERRDKLTLSDEQMKKRAG